MCLHGLLLKVVSIIRTLCPGGPTRYVISTFAIPSPLRLVAIFFYEGLHKLAATLERFFGVPPYFLEVLPQGQEPRLGLLAATSFSCL